MISDRVPTRRRPIHRIGLAAAVLALGSGCVKPSASGAVDEVVVVASSEVWAVLEDAIVDALQSRAFTVRRERIFEVAYLAPADVEGSRVRRMRQVLLIGTAQDPLIVEALGDYGEEVRQPVLIQARDVWARNQVVTVVVQPESAAPGALEPLLPAARDALVRELENAIRVRMAITPTNERLTERLRREGRFTLLVPHTYDVERPEPGLFVFRYQAVSAEVGPVVRTITVDSRARTDVDWTVRAAWRWREDLVERLNRPPHATDTLSEAQRGRLAGRPILRVKGVWSTPSGEWPYAGPFLSRMVECPERVFLVDAWVYAPADEKYGHLYHLDRIVDTFRCPPVSAPGVAGEASVDER